MDGTAGTDGLPVGVIAEPFSYCIPCLHKGAKGKTGEEGERGDKGDKVKKGRSLSQTRRDCLFSRVYLVTKERKDWQVLRDSRLVNLILRDSV